MIKPGTSGCQNGMIGTTAATITPSPKVILKLKREETDVINKVRSDSMTSNHSKSHMETKLSTSTHLTDSVTHHTVTDLREEHLTLIGATTPKIMSKLRRAETDMINNVRSVSVTSNQSKVSHGNEIVYFRSVN